MKSQDYYEWKPNLGLKLNTTNFNLRSLRLNDDHNKHVSWSNNKDINKWLNSNWKKHSIDTVKDFIKTQDHFNIFHLGVFEKKNNEHIGNFSIFIDHHHKTAETRVLIGNKLWWGKGVVLECRSVIISWLFDIVKVYKIWGNPAMNNIAAVFNYQKQGYKCEAILKKHKISLDKKRYDVGIFSLTKEYWKN